MTLPACNVRIVSSSIKMESAVRYKALANNSTLSKVFARSAMRAIPSSMAHVSRLTRQPLPMSDAPSGAMEFALNAQRDGSSMPRRSALLSPIFAHHGTIMELVLRVTMDTSLALEPV